MTDYSKTDFADYDDETIRAAFAHAEDASGAEQNESPRPLFRPLTAPPSFPMEALGPTLSKAARAIESVVQCAGACAGNSVLAAAALTAQAVANVELPIGEGKVAPLSLDLLSVISSGERKTTADGYGLRVIREYEQELAGIEAQERAAYKLAVQVHKVQVAHAEKQHKSDGGALTQALTAIGAEPLPPLLSTIAPSGDSTIEGIYRIFEQGRPDLGIFSDDGATFLGGHSMKAEQKQATTAILCRYWDGAKVERIRGGDGVNVLFDRRLSCHLMVQPDVAAGFFNDRQFSDQGLLARFLIAAPEEMAGSRFRDDAPYRRAVRQAGEDLRGYNWSLGKLLKRPIRWRDENNRALGVERGLLCFTPAARARYVTHYNEIEALMAPGEALATIKPFASKLLEQAARIAGVITLVEQPEATTIEADIFDSAMVLARYYCGEALRLLESGYISPQLKEAESLRRWLHGWASDVISLRQVYQLGPNAIREAKKARAVMGILEAHGWVIPLDDDAKIDGKRVKEAWAIVRSTPGA